MPHILRAGVVVLLLILPGRALAGYTHYYTWKVTPERDRLSRCILEMRAILQVEQDRVAGPDGKGKPSLRRNEIAFNGPGDEGHEPFRFPGEPGANFCKTALKDYDEIVCACLLVARDHFSPSELEITSDSDGPGIEAGRELFQEVLYRKPRQGLHDVLSSSAGFGKWINLLISAGFFAVVVLVIRKVF